MSSMIHCMILLWGISRLSSIYPNCNWWYLPSNMRIEHLPYLHTICDYNSGKQPLAIYVAYTDGKCGGAQP